MGKVRVDHMTSKTDTEARDICIAELRKQQKSRDHEAAHIAADAVLCEFLCRIGFEDIVEEYEKLIRWHG